MAQTSGNTKLARRPTSITVDQQLWREFKSGVSLRGLSMTEVIEELITKWLAKRRENPAA